MLRSARFFPRAAGPLTSSVPMPPTSRSFAATAVVAAVAVVAPEPPALPRSRFLDQRSKRRVLPAVCRCVQFHLAKVADAGSETKAEQVHQREDMVGEPGRVRVVLFDPQITLVVE